MLSTQPNPDSGSKKHSQQEASASSTRSPPTLPAPEQKGEGDSTKLDVSGGGSTVQLDHLGPSVVNQNGTLSRIGNWPEMNEVERKNTLRILGKRNQLRLTKIRGGNDSGAEGASNAGDGEE